MEEDADHQFFFQSDIEGLAVTYTDMDANGNPVGLSTQVSTTDPGSGNLTVILRHEPAKDAEGVSDGLVDNAGGETDIQVTFSVNVQ